MEQSKTFMTLKETSRHTGMSVYSLRQGVKAGTIPHIVWAGKYLVNVPMMQERMVKESAEKCK